MIDVRSYTLAQKPFDECRHDHLLNEGVEVAVVLATSRSCHSELAEELLERFGSQPQHVRLVGLTEPVEVGCDATKSRPRSVFEFQRASAPE